MKKYKFKGLPSGDYESFCFDVTKEEFEKITGKKPSKWDSSKFNKGLYRLYPNDLFDGELDDEKEIEVEIIVKEVVPIK